LLFFAVGKVRISRQRFRARSGKKAKLPEYFWISEFRDARGIASAKLLQRVNDTDVSTPCCVTWLRRVERFLLGQDIPSERRRRQVHPTDAINSNAMCLEQWNLRQLGDNPATSVSTRTDNRATLHCGSGNVSVVSPT
jgi:hypothetical protein